MKPVQKGGVIAPPFCMKHNIKPPGAIRIMGLQINTMRYCWRLPVVLVMSILMVAGTGHPAIAFSISDYFTYSYEVQLSTTAVQGNEVFQATVSGQAVCKKDLPITPTAAYISSRIVARHTDTGALVTLNAGYRLDISSFPGKQGDTARETVVVPLVFPAGSLPGTYNVVGEIVEAKVQVLIWLDVTSQLPSSQEIGTVTYAGSTGGDGSNDSSDSEDTGEDITESGSISLTGYTDERGHLTQEVTVESADGRAALTITEGTVVKDSEGEPLSTISIAEAEEAPADSPDTQPVSPAYDFRPDGATFDQPVSMILGYDETLVPEGVSEERLTAAVWDPQIEQWQPRNSTVDPLNNTVTTEITHFSIYAVIAQTRPAAFSVSSLTVNPVTAGIEKTITIRVLVSNTGDLFGTYRLALKINGETTAIQEVNLKSQSSQDVIFTTTQDSPGTYTVEIEHLSGTFTVEATSSPSNPASFATSNLTISPRDVKCGEDVSISILVTNTGDLQGTHRVELKINGAVTASQDVFLEGGASQSAVFITSRDVPGIYDIVIDGLADSFLVEEKETPVVAEDLESLQVPLDLPFNWGLVGGISAGVVALLAMLVFLFLRQRRT